MAFEICSVARTHMTCWIQAVSNALTKRKLSLTQAWGRLNFRGCAFRIVTYLISGNKESSKEQSPESGHQCTDAENRCWGLKGIWMYFQWSDNILFLKSLIKCAGKKIKSAVRMHAYFRAEKSPKSIFSNDFVPIPQSWSHSIVSAGEGGEDLLALFLMRALKNVLHWTRLPGTLAYSTLGENRAVHLTPIPTSSLGFTKGMVRMRMQTSFSYLPDLKIKK